MINGTRDTRLGSHSLDYPSQLLVLPKDLAEERRIFLAVVDRSRCL